MWDVSKALQHLQFCKLSHPSARPQCAKWTRQAIEAGGILLKRHESAKDYGNSLRAGGFLPIPSFIQPFAGDVVVIEGFVVGNDHHPDGHMAMFDGKVWISDFEQTDIYPGSAYKRHRPRYTIWRHFSQFGQALVTNSLAKPPPWK